MARIKANIVAVTVFIDGSVTALFFKGRDESGKQVWRKEFAKWYGDMHRAGHKMRVDVIWRSDAEWPRCGCPDLHAAPNAFAGMFAKEGEGRTLESISFEPYTLNIANKKARASFKAQG